MFVQVRSVSLRAKKNAEDDAEDAEEDLREALAQKLKGLGRKFHSYALTQLVSSARSDPFGKIRGLIEGMIAKLTKEAAEEADQKSFCDEELSESKAKQTEISGKLDKTVARVEKAEADKAKIDGGQAEATKVLQEEH